jgi:hypothetical protein
LSPARLVFVSPLTRSPHPHTSTHRLHLHSTRFIMPATTGHV